LPPISLPVTQRDGAHRRSRSTAHGCKSLLAHRAVKRFPYSKLASSAAGLLEHRVEVRLRGLQSIMVRPRHACSDR
jgi:hypothetical protein